MECKGKVGCEPNEDQKVSVVNWEGVGESEEIVEEWLEYDNIIIDDQQSCEYIILNEEVAAEEVVTTVCDTTGDDVSEVEIVKVELTKCGDDVKQESHVMEEAFDDDEDDGYVESSTKVMCEICDKQYDDPSALNVHMRIHRNTEHLCRICNTKHKYLTLHIEAEHSCNGKYPCMMCPTVSETPETLKIHWSLHFLDEVRCQICGTIVLSSKFALHMRVHSEKKHKCKLCDKSYNQAKELRIHVMRHTGEKPFMCEQCGRRFLQKEYLQRHKLIVHKGHRPFFCVECGKTFSTSSLLKTHTTMHTGARPFTCSLCDKTFRTGSSFVTHKNRMHSDKRRFKCTNCDKQYVTKHLLTLHMQKHTGESLFNCDRCKKSFYSKFNLERHVQKHLCIEAGKFMCKKCKCRFSSISFLNEHVAMKNCYLGKDAKLTSYRKIHVLDNSETYCKRCDQNYDDIDEHMRIHLDAFKCELCDKYFDDSSQFVNHMKTTHATTHTTLQTTHNNLGRKVCFQAIKRGLFHCQSETI